MLEYIDLDVIIEVVCNYYDEDVHTIGVDCRTGRSQSALSRVTQNINERLRSDITLQKDIEEIMSHLKTCITA